MCCHKKVDEPAPSRVNGVEIPTTSERIEVGHSSMRHILIELNPTVAATTPIMPVIKRHMGIINIDDFLIPSPILNRNMSKKRWIQSCHVLSGMESIRRIIKETNQKPHKNIENTSNHIENTSKANKIHI